MFGMFDDDWGEPAVEPASLRPPPPQAATVLRPHTSAEPVMRHTRWYCAASHPDGNALPDTSRVRVVRCLAPVGLEYCAASHR